MTPEPINRNLLDLYTDYLISSFGQTTATGFAKMLNNTISHDKITRFLSLREYTSKDLWLLVKKDIRRIETEDAVLSLDDTIVEKHYTDENNSITWHFDHSKGRNVKGLNILNATYHNSNGTIPLAFDIVQKTEKYTDPKTGKEKRRSAVTKNGMMRSIIARALKNKVLFRYVLADIWFSSKENMEWVVENKKHFIFALKANRLVFLPGSSMSQTISSLELKADTVITCYLKGLSFPVQILKKVFTNQDGSTGILYLATSDTDLSATDVYRIYQKRWNVEEYHKSIKSNLGIAKSPTRTEVTQNNHCFAAIYAYCKMECLRSVVGVNHFALKSRLYITALKASFQELQLMKNNFCVT